MADLTFIYGAMSCGKSAALLQRAYNYERGGNRVRLYTAAVDARYGMGMITSRLGVSRKALTFDAGTKIADLCRRDVVNGQALACLFVDEANLLAPEQVHDLHRLANVDGIPVFAYGLRSDFRAMPFPGSMALLAIADRLEELSTVCACAQAAKMNMRIDADGRRVTEGEQVEIGGDDRYRGVCPSCFYAAA